MTTTLQALVDNITVVAKAGPVSQTERDNATKSMIELVTILDTANKVAWDFVAKQFLSSPNLLLSYAFAAAQRAVTTNDLMWIKVGIVAVMLDDLRTDWRESLMMLSLLGHSSRKMGCDPLHLSSELSINAEPKCAQIVLDYFAQPLPQQSIELMGFKEEITLDGFAFVPVD